MIYIKNENQYNSELSDFDGIYCLLFSKEGSPPCLAMEKQLSSICSEHSIKLLKIDCNLKESYNFTSKYSVGMLPKYIFLKNDKTLYEDSGTENRYTIEKQINKWSK